MKSFKAMILAAGLATRLRPLTLSRPKVLVPVQNRPLLDWLVAYLWAGGAEEVIINTYHLSEKLIEYVERSEFPIPVHLRVEKTLLGTGGGIRNVMDFLDHRPFVVINGDILSAIDLQGVLRSHEDSGATVTLVLKDEPLFNGVKVASDGRILGFSGGSEKHLTFTGIHVLERRVLAEIPADIPSSIIDCYLRLIAGGEKVMAHVVEDEFWRELGSLNGYLQMHEEFFRMSQTPVPGLQVDGEAVVHESARLGSENHFDGMVCIGAGCALEHGVRIQRSVLWEQVTIGSGCSIRDSILGDGVVITESLEGVVIGSEGRKELGTRN